jgi:hypothetical protein
MPPLPTPDASRSRGGWVDLPPKGRKGTVPKLERVHSDAGVRLWRRWWRSPMATQWEPLDAVELERLLDLYEACWAAAATGESAAGTVLSELRQLADRFGLNPTSRLAKRWRVHDTSSSAPTVEAPAGALPSYEAALRLVQGGGA